MVMKTSASEEASANTGSRPVPSKWGPELVSGATGVFTKHYVSHDEHRLFTLYIYRRLLTTFHADLCRYWRRLGGDT